jgi:hypothetical protein
VRHWLSRERRKHEALVEQLARLDDAYFEKLGVSREELARDFAEFLGELVFPVSPGYDQARALSNPRFDFHRR